MAHLTDMEELLSKVQSQDIRDYMAESLSCYMAGAYRASVVLTFIALFDDILAKLGELGKVNKKARTIHAEASKKRSDQDVYETYLIDQLKSNALLTSLDAGFLETLRTLRNKAAHPSGHHASAEEARFVFYEAISRFLSRPILSTTQLADQILASLGNENLFPSNMIGDTEAVVKKDLVIIHPETYPYLISKLVEKSRESDSNVARNARFYLNALARVGGEEAVVAIRKHAITPLASSKADTITVLGLISANGKFYSDLDEITYKRLAVLIEERVDAVTSSVTHTSFSHPASIFARLFAENPPEMVLEKLGKQFNAFLDRFPYSAYFTKQALSYNLPRKLLLDKLNENAGSSDFSTANEFARHIGDLENFAAEDLSAEEAFRLIVSTIRAAEIGAFSSIDLRNAHFASAPRIRDKALEFLATKSNEAHALARAILGEEDVDDSLKFLQPLHDE